jgi:tripartite-type tricarboxylate transporter receptor subunit TctC
MRPRRHCEEQATINPGRRRAFAWIARNDDLYREDMMQIWKFALGALVLASAPAKADPVADFYAGRTITLIISTGVGGGVDTNARIVARHMGAHIPGHPAIVPSNMTGAGHLRATNYIYGPAPQDGTTIAAILPAFVGYQVLDGKGASYDAKKIPFLGSSDVENANLYTWHTVGIKSIDEIKQKQVLMGSTGAGSYTALYPTLLNNVLGMKFKIVSGYKSTNEIHLAMERGEVQGRAGNFFSSLKSQNPDWLRDKKIDILLQIGAARDPEWPQVPLLTDLATNDEQRQIFKVFSAEIALGRTFVTTPGVPADRLAALRAAFAQTMRDPAFRDEIGKANMQSRPLSYEKAREIADQILNLPPDVIARAKAAMQTRAGDEQKKPAK